MVECDDLVEITVIEETCTFIKEELGLETVQETHLRNLRRGFGIRQTTVIIMSVASAGELFQREKFA